MFYESLFFGALLWSIGLAALRWPGWWTAAFVIVRVLFLIGLPFPPVAMVFVTMGLVVGIGPYLRSRPRIAVAFALAAFALPYGSVSFGAWKEVQEAARLRAEYPFESLADRLPAQVALTSIHALPAEAAKELDKLEREIVEGDHLGAGLGGMRESSLRTLHERQTNDFVNSPGFGSMRMYRGWKRNLKTKLPDEPVPQPMPIRASASLSDSEPWKPRPPNPTDPNFAELHRQGVVDFVNEEGFGYVKDRAHVAGFRPHRFTEAPQPKGTWSVATVELVGLLLHPEPVAYVSDNLPRMNDLRGAPTRTLDEFEKAGLSSLERGEDLFTAETPTGMRMLGSVRATKQCLKCHDGERGRLLGAFSYWMREGKPKDEIKTR